MASSSLCGPTNALQNLSKHTAVDRSLQQDRLRTPTPAGSQSFRSSPNAQLDSDFSRFQSPQPQHQHHAPPPHLAHQLHHQHSAPQMHSPQMDGWATDFQRLSLHPTQRSHTPQSKGKAPAMSAWDAEFLKFQQQTQQKSPVHQQQQPMQRPMMNGGMMNGMNQGAMGMGMGGMNMGMTGIPMQQMYQPQPQYSMQLAPQPTYAPQVEQQVQQQPEVGNQELDAAFDAAFDAVLEAESGQLSAESQHDALDVLETELQREAAEPLTTLVEPLMAEPIVEQQPVQAEEEQPPADDNDALSKTAAELLDSVSNDTSEKFQNSKFLELMRRLRDREVRVEGDKVVEVLSKPEQVCMDGCHPQQTGYLNVDGEDGREKHWNQFFGREKPWICCAISGGCGGSSREGWL
ncbi:hypothetical protein BJ508DRAFT_93082 [Ascobolus immersus RN42]|uniref:Peroxin 20 n=1 Tax=Ascobolus immersus RN42 TaxID=1160509 RepID=A0A3N4I7Y3_ASCIM|nr:hypothetical protein BJ508DRAFT_93082 [Ascobolus immersus RN42]